MKYLLTFNIKYIFVFTVLAFALLFTVLASSTDGQGSTPPSVRGNFPPESTVTSTSTITSTSTTGTTKLGCSLRELSSCKGIEDLVNALYKSLFVFGGVLGVFMIMFRGIAITIATAQGAVVKRDDAITDFENVVIGLGLLALSYIILDIINPDILSF